MSEQTTAAGPARGADRIAEITRAIADDLDRAIALAVAARADGVVSSLVHHLIGLKLRREGRPDEAVLELGEGLKLAPDHVGLMTEVGFCLIEMGRRQEAARVMATAVKLDPNSADACFGYGWASEGIGALDAAEAAFKRALALNPKYADALVGLSGLAVRRREWEAGRDYAQRAAAIDPGQTDALTNLARIDVGEGKYDEATRRLREIIALPSLPPQARANAHLILGDALDGAQRHAEAFDAYTKGKSEFGEQFAADFGGERAHAALKGVRDILTEFEATPAESWRAPKALAPKSAERGHAFLVGFPRSGTTLLEQVLAAHPDVVALDERPVMMDAETEFLTQDGGVGRLAATPSEALALFREAYWRRVRAFGSDPTDKVFIDKHPLSTFRLPLIFKVFPGAKIIFALRDPRDVVFSCFRRSFNMNASMYEFNSIESAARYYDAVMAAGQVFLERLPVEVIRVRYEDLVADFEGQGRGVLDFLGLEWTDEVTNFAEQAKGRRIATPSSAQVVRGLYNEGVGQWRNYASALEPAASILAPWIRAFGYEP
jgi:tetratricopeptide (TPR) repeat protein